MTADVELLPLPPARLVIKHDRGPISETEPFWNKRDVSDYARARVAHATAAKDAEIEALRAEVAKRDGIDPWAVLLRAQGAEARAERLADALRAKIAEAQASAWATTDARWREAMISLAAELSAALHPTAAQGNDDA